MPADFVAGFADLGREQADPDLFNFLTLRPERHEFREITGALGHLTCNGAMDCDLRPSMPFRIRAYVCGFAALVMFGRQAVDRDDDLHSLESLPLTRDFSNSTGYNVRANAAFVELWKNLIQLTEPDKRFATDN